MISNDLIILFFICLICAVVCCTILLYTTHTTHKKEKEKDILMTYEKAIQYVITNKLGMPDKLIEHITIFYYLQLKSQGLIKLRHLSGIDTDYWYATDYAFKRARQLNLKPRSIYKIKDNKNEKR